MDEQVVSIKILICLQSVEISATTLISNVYRMFIVWYSNDKIVPNQSDQKLRLFMWSMINHKRDQCIIIIFLFNRWPLIDLEKPSDNCNSWYWAKIDWLDYIFSVVKES